MIKLSAKKPGAFDIKIYSIKYWRVVLLFNDLFFDIYLVAHFQNTFFGLKKIIRPYKNFRNEKFAKNR